MEDIDINFLDSKNNILKRWLCNFPSSVKMNISSILSINSEDPEVDIEVIKCFKNCRNYYVVQSEYDNYKNCVNKLFGKHNFKVSYSDIFDYELDPSIRYDLVIFYTNFNLNDDVTSFINKSLDFMNKGGQILIITCSNDKFVLEARKYFRLNFISDKEFKDKLKFNGKIFNTHISTFLNVNKLNKIEMLKLTNENISDEKIEDFKKFALEKYGDYVSVPISVIILKN